MFYDVANDYGSIPNKLIDVIFTLTVTISLRAIIKVYIHVVEETNSLYLCIMLF